MGQQVQRVGVVGAGAMGRALRRCAPQRAARYSCSTTSSRGNRVVWPRFVTTSTGSCQGQAVAGGCGRDTRPHPARPRLARVRRLRSGGRGIVEQLEPKQQLFRALEATVSPDCILATKHLFASASPRSPRNVQTPSGWPEWHFFNPVARHEACGSGEVTSDQRRRCECAGGALRADRPSRRRDL